MRAPVILMVLAATVIPVELRSPVHGSLGSYIQPSDVLLNVAGYVPVGIVLGGLAPLRAVITAALMTTFAEASQFAMLHRDPSAVDVVANVIGAILGTVIGARWRIRSLVFRISRWSALAAATLAVALVLGVRAMAAEALNVRGATSAGTLEAHWNFDEDRGHIALDSSGHDLRGRFNHQPLRTAGVRGGGAIALDGARTHVDFGRSSAFRLVGSMTISAWINSSSYPADDAAIVSNVRHVGDSSGGYGLGFQLDTTVDRGPRTIGFKLFDVCGNLMARYGATPLLVGTWYHVAGVYDAAARTMNVYLNGELDNGFLLGTVTGAHRSSREPVYVGRRTDLKGYEFAGAIDDVRIYSLALTKAEIAADMGGTGIDNNLGVRRASGLDLDSGRYERLGESYEGCTWSSEREDAKLPGAVAALGVLLAVASIGLWPSGGPKLSLAVSFFAGLLLCLVASPTLPRINLWIFPVTSLAGGASVAVSLRVRGLDD